MSLIRFVAIGPTTLLRPSAIVHRRDPGYTLKSRPRNTMAKTDFKSVNEYIASRPKDVQAILRRVRSIIRKAVPDAEEGISYQIPAYRLNSRLFLFFAGWKEHYSLYPASNALVTTFKKELEPYAL